MRFVIYKNSVLATFCSMFGAAFIAMAVMAMISGELGIMPGIGVIAAGLGFMWLGDFISTKKAERKRKKARQNAAANAPASAAGYVPQQQTARGAYSAPASAAYGSPDVPAAPGRPVNKSVIFAGVFFLLGALLEFWACKSYSYFMRGGNTTLNSENVMLIAMGLLMLIAAFRTKQIQKVSVLFVLGFLGVTLGSVDVFLVKWRDYAWLSNNPNTLFQWSAEPMFRAIGYFVMFLFALFSMRKIKKQLGGIVRYLWIIPGIILVLAYTKLVADSGVLIACRRVFNPQWIGLKNIPREVLDATAHLFVIAAVFFSAFCFRRISCRPAVVFRQETYAQPNPPYAPPAQPQPALRYTAPEPPKQPEPAPKANGQNIEEQIQACKDLLECGLLTQAEYEQKIRELMREYNGG